MSHKMEKVILGIFAHPDDAEIICAGTLSLFKKAGWTIHIATMAPGDKGSTRYARQELSKIRKEEATNAAKLIGGTYHCLELEDVYILYDRESINRTTALIRRVRPTIILTASPNDYMVDHEMTSMIVQTACFSTGIKNMEVDEESFEPMPHLYYSDPLEGKDKFGNPVIPSMYVDISTEIDVKEKMLACHISQSEWLKAHHQGNEYLLSMKRFAKKRGKEINTMYAEGFRQHLGHGYPLNNVLKEELGNLVYMKNSKN